MSTHIGRRMPNRTSNVETASDGRENVEAPSTWPRIQSAPERDPSEGEGRSIRLALAQISSEIGDENFDPRANNLERAITVIEEAARAGVQLVCFGEMYLTGYRTDTWIPIWANSLDPPDAHIERLLRCAAATKTHIIIGAAVRGGFIPGDVYNAAIIMSPEGIIGMHAKVHLATFPYGDAVAMEGAFASPGRSIDVFETRLCRLGVHICYDSVFPELPRVQALNGAELLVNCAAAGAGFEEWWDHLLAVRAIENRSWYVMTSVVGAQADTSFFGGSRVVDPDGATVAAATHNEEEVVHAEIDLRRASVARAASHMLSIRQPQLYSALIDPIPFP